MLDDPQALEDFAAALDCEKTLIRVRADLQEEVMLSARTWRLD